MGRSVIGTIIVYSGMGIDIRIKANLWMGKEEVAILCFGSSAENLVLLPSGKHPLCVLKFWKVILLSKITMQHVPHSNEMDVLGI